MDKKHVKVNYYNHKLKVMAWVRGECRVRSGKLWGLGLGWNEGCSQMEMMEMEAEVEMPPTLGLALADQNSCINQPTSFFSLMPSARCICYFL